MQTEIYMPELTVQQRREALETHAVSIEEKKYQKPLSADDLDVRREKLTDNAIKLSEFDDELTIIKKDFKAKMDPLQMENKTLLTEIKTKQTTVAGTLFHLQNFDSGWMETFNEDGELIATRKLRPDEKQGTIFSLQKAQ